jgi:hypothetical protein
MNFPANNSSSPALRCSPTTAARKSGRRLCEKLVVIFFLVLLAVALLPKRTVAQESSSRPAPEGSFVPAGPSGALSQALSAACTQSQTEFAKYLTARNRQSFTRMTPAARIALMKRFVLLSQPGKPTIALNVSGRPTVRCETPDGAAEIQIGGADQQDNLAFLPVELRDATDTSGTDVVRVNMGLVREDSQWRLLSLGVVLLDLPALEVEWNAEQIGANELAALDNLKMVTQAIETYRRTYTRLPESLAKLGPPADNPNGKGKIKPSADAADLLDSELAGGSKGGYAFRYAILGASDLGAVAKFELAASPVPYGAAGKRSYFREANGTIHAGDHKGAVGSTADPKAE